MQGDHPAGYLHPEVFQGLALLPHRMVFRRASIDMHA